MLKDGTVISGTWDDIVETMRTTGGSRSAQDFMLSAARREYARTGILLSTADCESFLRASADAGLLRILQ
jgi:hypothetical protein